MWEGEALKAFLLLHRFDSVSITLGNWIKTYHGVAEWRGVATNGLVNVAWVVCFAIAALELSCILDSCTISASYEVSEAQKALLLLPHAEKGSSTSSEHYANLPDPTHHDALLEH